MTAADIITRWDSCAREFHGNPTAWLLLLRIAREGAQGITLPELRRSGRARITATRGTLEHWKERGLVTLHRTLDARNHSVVVVTATHKANALLGIS